MVKENWQSSTGRPYEDKRDWQAVNEELVRRGEFLLDFDWVKSWDDELEEMNRNKRGAPFEFPESLIKLQAVWCQLVSLRYVEGITRQLVNVAGLPDYNDYSTINRRIIKLDLGVELPEQDFVSVCTDGSGMKMYNTGEYRREKYGGKKRKWIKVVITTNPLTKKLLAVEADIEGEGKSEPEYAKKHLSALWEFGYVVDKFWGDGSFDVLDLFNLLEEHDTESAIPPRDNASHNSNGSMRRLLEVFEFQTKDWADWAREKSYGIRWLGTECYFSAVKRVFGENTRAKKPETACLEAERKFWVYDRMQQYAKA